MKTTEEFLKSIRMESPTQLVQCMGGILAGCIFKTFEIIKDDDDEKTFLLETDKYKVVNTFSANSDWDKLIVINSIEKCTNENGIMVSLLHNQILYATKAGFEQLYCKAPRSKENIGYYIFLNMGFVPLVRTGFEKKFNDLIAGTEFRNSESYLDLLKTQEGRDFWKENGFEFEGVFDLEDNSLSRLIFEKYLQTRQIQ